MALNQIGKNSTEEFFETFIYMTAYAESRELIKGYLDEYIGDENPMLREATESALQVATFGGIFFIIQKEEQLIAKVFASGGVAITALQAYAKSKWAKIKSSGRKGRIFKMASKFMGDDANDANQKSLVISQLMGNYVSARGSANNAGSLFSGISDTKRNVISQDRSAMQLGKGKADSYINSLLFKLLTSNFTSTDEQMIKKILGRDSAQNLSVDDLNKMGSFLFTKDNEGNITGMTEQFFSLINGLGYIHNK